MFAVFGVCKGWARKKALEITPQKENGLDLGVEEFTRRAMAAAQIIYLNAKPRQLGPEFDAPQFAEEYKSLIQRSDEGRLLVIKVWRQKINKKGEKVRNKKGRPMFGWAQWSTGHE